MWSEELRGQTREFFKKWPMAMMKHSGDGKFGVCHVKDGRYFIEGDWRCRRSAMGVCFDRGDDRGWVGDRLRLVVSGQIVNV